MDTVKNEAKRYVVESFYNYNSEPAVDYCTIYPETPEAIEHNSDNWTGSLDAYRIDCYESLEEAIKKAMYWPTSIKYSDDLSAEEMEIATKTVKELIADEAFCKRFGREPYTGPIKI